MRNQLYSMLRIDDPRLPVFWIKKHEAKHGYNFEKERHRFILTEAYAALAVMFSFIATIFLLSNFGSTHSEEIKILRIFIGLCVATISGFCVYFLMRRNLMRLKKDLDLLSTEFNIPFKELCEAKDLGLQTSHLNTNVEGRKRALSKFQP